LTWSEKVKIISTEWLSLSKEEKETWADRFVVQANAVIRTEPEDIEKGRTKAWKDIRKRVIGHLLAMLIEH